MSSEGFLEIDRCVTLREWCQGATTEGSPPLRGGILRFAQNDTKVTEIWNPVSYS